MTLSFPPRSAYIVAEVLPNAAVLSPLPLPTLKSVMRVQNGLAVDIEINRPKKKKKLRAVQHCRFTKAECTLLPSYMCTIPCNSIVSTLELSCAVRWACKEHEQGRHTLYIYVYSRWLPRPISGGVILTQDKAQFFAFFVLLPFCASSRDDHWTSSERQIMWSSLLHTPLRCFFQRENGELKFYEWRLRMWHILQR